MVAHNLGNPKNISNTTNSSQDPAIDALGKNNIDIIWQKE